MDRNGGLVAWKGAAGQAAVIDAGLALPGTTGNYASTPHSAALNPSGVITVTALAEDVTIGASQIFVGKWTSVGDQRGWQFLVSAAGKLRFMWSTTGANALTQEATAGFSRRFVRVEFDPSTGGAVFDESDDASTWVPIGSPGAAGATSIYACTTDLFVSGRNGGSAEQFGPGVIGSVLVEDGGGAVASPDFAAAAPGVLTVTDDQSNVWTINQTADGSDDPTMEPTPDTGHVSFPLTADNTVSTPKQGGWTTVEWEVFFADDTSETGTTTADPVVV
ncbi:MAG: hypothetical protein GY754_43400, partial [bacterium]|nr:hypothetical protein [bacterium]